MYPSASRALVLAGLLLGSGVVAADRQGVYVVHREELPEDDDLARGLAEAFGAEPGDEVIEVRPGREAQRWRLARAA